MASLERHEFSGLSLVFRSFFPAMHGSARPGHSSGGVTFELRAGPIAPPQQVAVGPQRRPRAEEHCGRVGEGGCREPRPPIGDFRELYERHFSYVWRCLRLLGVPFPALEDAAQETFHIAAQKLSEFEGRSRVETWLFSIARRVAANTRRTHRRKVAPLAHSGVDLHESEAPNPEQQVEVLRALRLIEGFCRTLDETDRELFVLAIVEGAPAVEAAETLGRPLNTVYSRIRRLRLRLKGHFEAAESGGGNQ